MKKLASHSVVRLIAATILVCGGLAVTGLAKTPAIAENLSEQEGYITLEGTATIYGEWSCEGQAAVQTTPGEALAPVPGFPGGVQSTLVTVNVQNIDCGDGTMNKHMRKALKEEDYPVIKFKTNKYALNENGDVVKAIGELTIAGVTNLVELDASLVNQSEEEGFQVEGKVDIQMKDYKIKPPSRLFGMLKVKNSVSIIYNATIESPNQAQPCNSPNPMGL